MAARVCSVGGIEEKSETSSRQISATAIGAITNLTFTAGAAFLKVGTRAFEDRPVGDKACTGIKNANLYIFGPDSGWRLKVKRPAPVPEG